MGAFFVSTVPRATAIIVTSATTTRTNPAFIYAALVHAGQALVPWGEGAARLYCTVKLAFAVFCKPVLAVPVMAIV